MSPPCIEKEDIFETEIQPIEVNGTETKNESKISSNICPQDDQKVFQKSLPPAPFENLSGNFDSTKVFENFNNAYGDMVMEFKNMVVKQTVYEKEIIAKKYFLWNPYFNWPSFSTLPFILITQLEPSR